MPAWNVNPLAKLRSDDRHSVNSTPTSSPGLPAPRSRCPGFLARAWEAATANPDGDDGSPLTLYDVILADLPFLARVINTVVTLHIHFKRALLSSVQADCSSRSERAAIMKRTDLAKDSHLVFGFLAWRRSMAILMVLAAAVGAIFASVDVQVALDQYEWTREVAAAPLDRRLRADYISADARDFFDLPDPDEWITYPKMIVWGDNYCLGAESHVTANNWPVATQQCGGRGDETWYWEGSQLRNANSKCLAYDGADVYTYSCSANVTSWAYTGTYLKTAGQCLTTAGAGGAVSVAPCTGADEQKFDVQSQEVRNTGVFYYWGVDLFGNDLGSTAAVASKEECADICRATDGCLFFSYSMASLTCFAKTSDGGYELDSDMVSGRLHSWDSLEPEVGYLVELDMLVDSTTCPDGFSLINYDLNEGSNAVYLCQRFSLTETPITSVEFNGYSNEDDTPKELGDAGCPDDDLEQVGGNARTGLTGGSAVYVCVKRDPLAMALTNFHFEGAAASGCREIVPLAAVYECEEAWDVFELEFEPFYQYSIRMMYVIMALATEQAMFVQACIEAAVCALAWAAVAFAAAALLAWISFPRSSRLALIGWFCTFAAPFCVSVLPLKIFLDWDRAEGVDDAYLFEFREEYNLAEFESMVLDSCDALQDVTTDNLYEAIALICGYNGDVGYSTAASWVALSGLNTYEPIDGYPGLLSEDGSEGYVTRYLPWEIIDYDLEPFWDDIYFNPFPAHVRCGEARVMVADGDADEALDSAKLACIELSDLIEGEGNAQELQEIIDEMVGMAQTAIGLTLAFVHALSSFKIMLPAAVAIAPALIRASLKCKGRVPQATEPGVFIIMLPWLYAPVIWTVYSVVFQIMGNAYLLPALWLISYAPFAYFVYGIKRRVTKPMTDREVSEYARRQLVLQALIFTTAYSLGIYGLFYAGEDSQDNANYAWLFITSMLSAGTIMSLLFSALSKLIFTTVAGVDYMLKELVTQRLHELYLQTGQYRGRNVKSKAAYFNDREGKVLSAAELETERAWRLDQFCLLTVPFMTSTATQPASAKPSTHREFDLLDDGQQSWRSFLNMTRYLHVHIRRAHGASLLEHISSKAERAMLATTKGLSEVARGPLNLLTWRRSALIVMFFFSVLYSGFAVSTAMDEAQNYIYYKELAEAPTHRNIEPGYISDGALEFFDLPDPGDWIQYIGNVVVDYDGTKWCLGAPSSESLDVVVQMECATSTRQLWTLDQEGKLYNQDDLCLDVAVKAIITDGTEAVIYSCGAATTWTFLPVDEAANTGLLKNDDNGFCLGSGGNSAENAELGVYTCDSGDASQLWDLPSESDCQNDLDEYCEQNANCAYYPSYAPLYARYSTSDVDDSDRWRCYYEECLTEDNAEYDIGNASTPCTVYCDAETELTDLLQSCQGEEDFYDYTERVLKMGTAAMLVDAQRVEVIMATLVALLAWVSVLMNVLAIVYWAVYPVSRRYLLIGWFCSFCAPFLVSLVPVRLFVQWDATDAIGEQYLHEFTIHFQLEEKQQQALDMCDTVEDINFDDIEDMIESICGRTSTVSSSEASDWIDKADFDEPHEVPQYVDGGATLYGYPATETQGVIDQYIPLEHYDINIEIFGITIVDVDINLYPMHVYCGDARAFLFNGYYNEALEEAQQACDELVEAIGETPGGYSEEILEVVNDLIESMKESAEVTVGLTNALESFRVMVPAAVSLAPGLIRAALKTKTLLPMSSLPGLLAQLLPWVYCPLCWTLYNAVLQLVGNEYLLPGLLIMAYAPLGVFFVGTRMEITKPMGDLAIRDVTKWIGVWQIFCSLIAYTFIIYGLLYMLFWDDGSSDSTIDYFIIVLRDLFGFEAICALVASVVTKYYFTTLAGTDFMVKEVISQRRYEVFLSTGVYPTTPAAKRSQSVAGRFAGALPSLPGWMQRLVKEDIPTERAADQNFEALKAEREARLDKFTEIVVPNIDQQQRRKKAGKWQVNSGKVKWGRQMT